MLLVIIDGPRTPHLDRLHELSFEERWKFVSIISKMYFGAPQAGKDISGCLTA